MSFIRKRTRGSGGIDVSPMLDMVFILLIFFIQEKRNAKTTNQVEN